MTIINSEYLDLPIFRLVSECAEKLGVRVSDLRKWNGLSGSRITAGKRLKIYK